MIRSLAFIALSLLPSLCLAFCFEQAEQETGISREVLMAIAKVESNFRPYAINWNRNGTYDFGLMQINSSWYKVLGHERWMMLGDPCYNVRVAAWILKQCIMRYGYTWKAVGCYHSPKSSRQVIYVDKVRAVINKHRESKTLNKGGG